VPTRPVIPPRKVQVALAKTLALTLMTPVVIEANMWTTTGPAAVLRSTGLLSASEGVQAGNWIHAPLPALADGSNRAMRIPGLPPAGLSSQATMGWPSAPMAMLGRRDMVAVLETPPSLALPASSSQPP